MASCILLIYHCHLQCRYEVIIMFNVVFGNNVLRTTASLSNDAYVFLESKAVVKFQNGFMFIVELT